MAPATPSEVPVIRTVKGIITINRMMNGSERKMFTIVLGLPLGVLLFLCSPRQLFEQKACTRCCR